MTTSLKIDFVSDISCPWCIIGLRGLEEALVRASDAVEAAILFQPFELNPGLPAGGQNMVEHIEEKYGSTAEQLMASRAMICERAGNLGFTMRMSDESRIYNTFDAHRLLHWAEIEGRQKALKEALFAAYFTDQRDPSDHEVLVDVVGKAGLDKAKARELLSSDRYAAEVREAEARWRSRGITSVPVIVVNEKYLISGGQPPEAFEKALRGMAAEFAEVA